ncbi:MAG: type I-U CRISPR-associated protein Csb2 [Dehalococcoidales bacterium]|nr:type I-U CRISPR-associated protein Csb2 [Dehalococcoidales bacterium]
MLVIGLSFPAGRYHATPWGRHVNEADVEWPPSPWRIIRALIATWHRKTDQKMYPESLLDSLVQKLAAAPPAYSLPPATLAHTRHYMPVREGRADKPVLIFDAFVRVHPTDQLVVVWPAEVVLEDQEKALLEALLRNIGFLGRAESWVEAKRLPGWDGEINCAPGELSLDTKTGEMREPVDLIAPLPAEDYADWRSRTVAALGLTAKRLKKAQKQVLATLPERLIDALRLDTGDVQAAGWNRPPGARFITYQRLYGCFTPNHRGTVGVRRRQGEKATTARLALAGRPLPRIEEAVRIGELVRMAAMKQAEHLGEGVPPVLSGHDLPEDSIHGHAFYLPEANDDGRIDHVLIYAADGLCPYSLRALDRITRLWQHEGSEWQVLLERYGREEDFKHLPCMGQSAIWESITPYLHPWFRKRGFDVEDQIRRECRERGLPEPELERLPTVRIQGRDRRPVHFRRFRSRRGLRQPDTNGSFWRLIFPEPVSGPLALGFGCHYGLGVFRRVGNGDQDGSGYPI